MTTQAERSASTRALIVAASARVFVSVGYEAATINAIAEAAGVSKGAVYHHFDSKQAVMAAAYEDAERRLVDRLQEAAVGQQRALDAMRAGIRAFLTACLEPDTRRLLLVEAPAALGWEQWREIDARYGLGLLRAAVAAAVDAGEVTGLDVDATARLLLAAVMEGALLIGASSAPERELDKVMAVIDALVAALTAPRPPGEGAPPPPAAGPGGGGRRRRR